MLTSGTNQSTKGSFEVSDEEEESGGEGKLAMSQ